jgi:hypothetical protein
MHVKIYSIYFQISVLRSILTYVSPIWGYAANAYRNKLEAFENKVLRIKTKLPRIITNCNLTWTDVNVINKKSYQEVKEGSVSKQKTAYFPFTAQWVFENTRTAERTPPPTTFEWDAIWRLKAGILEPEETVVARQFVGGGAYKQTARRSHKSTFVFQNKGSKLKIVQ